MISDLIAEWQADFPDLLSGLHVSVVVTFWSLVFGIPIGLLLAVMVSAKTRLPRWVALVLVEVGRGTPALVLLQFVYFGLPATGLTLTSVVASVAALAWNTGAYTSEIIRAGLDSVPFGQREAAVAIGLTRLDALRYVIVPQGLRVSIPALLGFAILTFQATSLCFTIALPELLSRAYGIGAEDFHYFDVLVLAGLLYAAICIPSGMLVKRLEQRIGHYAT
jgi:polar amino acid transport system permease protein